jgi:hypothetical protein
MNRQRVGNLSCQKAEGNFTSLRYRVLPGASVASRFHCFVAQLPRNLPPHYVTMLLKLVENTLKTRFLRRVWFPSNLVQVTPAGAGHD